MGERKSIDGLIFLPNSYQEGEITHIAMVPSSEIDETGNYLVRDRSGELCVPEIPRILSDGRTMGLIISFKGLHTGLRKGERINVRYETIDATLNHGLSYEILDEKNLPVFIFN